MIAHFALWMSAFIMVSLSPTYAQAQAQTKPESSRKPAAPPNQEVVRLLRAWEQKSEDMKSLKVEFTKIEVDEETRESQGEAWFLRPDSAIMVFYEPKMKTKTEKQRILTVPGAVWVYEIKKREVCIYPIPAGQARDAAQFGPLRFLFDLKTEDVLNRYHVTLLPEKAPSRSEHHFLEIIPKNPKERQEFPIIMIALKKSDHSPGFLRLPNSANSKHYEEYKIKDIVPNPTNLNPKSFEAIKPRGWKIIDDPLGVRAPTKEKARTRPGN